ncbi:hypothetical protein D3C72_2342100 [compost metagenome]
MRQLLVQRLQVLFLRFDAVVRKRGCRRVVVGKLDLAFGGDAVFVGIGHREVLAPQVQVGNDFSF